MISVNICLKLVENINIFNKSQVLPQPITARNLTFKLKELSISTNKPVLKNIVRQGMGIKVKRIKGKTQCLSNERRKNSTLEFSEQKTSILQIICFKV